MLFFQEFVKMRRASDQEFGKCCYVDSTPLPNDIDENPFDAFSSHGDSGVQCRMILVVDIASGEPVWFKIIPGNVLDVNTLKSITDDVKIGLDVEICEHALDAGYESEDLIVEYSLGGAEKSLVRLAANGKRVESVVLQEDSALAEREPPKKTIAVKMGSSGFRVETTEVGAVRT